METTSKHLKTSDIFPNQRVRESEKRKPQFYIPTTNYIIDRALAENDKEDTIKRFNNANGIIDTKTIEYVLKPFSNSVNSQRDQLRFPSKTRDIDIITPIKERYLGEFIKQYSNYQVYIHDSDSIFKRNKELSKAVGTFIVKKIQKLIDTGDEQVIENLDVDKFAKEFIEEWTDDRVIKGQKKLNLINDLTNSEVLYIQAFFYWWACEEVYTYRTIVNGDIEKEVIPPWEYYRIDSGEIFVEDDDMGMRKYRMSINQIIDRDRDILSKKDIDYIKSLLLKENLEHDGTIKPHLLQSRDSFEVYGSGDINDLSRKSLYDSSGMVDVYDCFWKTETLVYNLKYYDKSTGEVVNTLVPQDYKLDPLNGDISLEEEWINESYMSRRYGGKFEGVYIPATPVEVQRQEVNNISKCKLPVNGIVGLLKNNKLNPISTRLIPYQLLMRLYTFQQEKAIAKFKSFNLMPESILLDSEEMTLEDRLHYASIDDILPFNDENADAALYQSIKSMYNQGAERYIQILQEIRYAIKQEAMDIANMNEQRYGDINQQAGKSVTEYAITKATTGSILMFEMFNKFRERDYTADLDYSKAAWIDGKQGSYIDRSTNEIVYVDIDGIEELSSNLGVFIRNSALEEEKLKQYRNIALAASQNGEFSLAADAIHTENSTTIRRLIKKSEEARKEYEKNIEETRNNLQMQLQESKQKEKEMDNIHDKEMEILKQRSETERLISKLRVEMMKIQNDISNISSNVPDEARNKLDQANMELKRRKQALDELTAINSIQNNGKE